MDHKQRTVRACTACKRRKVKCNGAQGCQQCTHLNLACIYPSWPKPSSSRRSIIRGHVIEAIKCPPRPLHASHPVALRPASSEPSAAHHDKAESPSSSSSFDAKFFTDLLPNYTAHVFPFLPIIPESELVSSITRLATNRDDRALVYILGALTIHMTRMRPGYPPNSSNQVKSLYTTALELLGTPMPHDWVTLQSIIIPAFVSIFLSANHCNVDMGFYYLREAINRVQLLRLDKPDRLALDDARERNQQERLYWMLFVHERFISLSSYRGVILPPLATLPGWDPSIPLEVLNGFNQIIQLFTVIDTDFVESWLDKRKSSITFAWIEKKQAELADDKYLWEDEISSLSALQQVDLIVTRYRFCTLLWQIALSKLLLTSSVDGGKDHMSMFFPFRLSSRLRSLFTTIPREAVEVHGAGILEKIFDVTDTIANILLHASVGKTDAGEIRVDHLENFLFLYRFLLSMSTFGQVERDLLQTKFDKLCYQFPSLDKEQIFVMR